MVGTMTSRDHGDGLQSRNGKAWSHIRNLVSWCKMNHRRIAYACYHVMPNRYLSWIEMFWSSLNITSSHWTIQTELYWLFHLWGTTISHPSSWCLEMIAQDLINTGGLLHKLFEFIKDIMNVIWTKLTLYDEQTFTCIDNIFIFQWLRQKGI